MADDMGTNDAAMGTPGGVPDWEIGELFSEGWRLFQENLGLLLGGVLVVGLIGVVANWASFGLAGFVIGGPFALGLFSLTLKLRRGEPADFNVIFSGFKSFLPAFLANLLILVFTMVGTILCVIPGIIVSFLYMLTYLYMYDKKLDFWPAMEASRTTVMANFGKWILLGIVLIAINFAGGLLCGIGVIVTAPLTLAIVTVAYDKTEGGAIAMPEEPISE